MNGESKAPLESYHRFLDEAGDTTFYGANRLSVIGGPGVSLCFILGMVKFRTALPSTREAVVRLQQGVEADPYFKAVPSIGKKKAKGGFFFHATDDVPEVRKQFFEWIRSVDCGLEAVVGRKIPQIYAAKHNGREAEFYADLLSHLVKNNLRVAELLVLNIAQRGKSTRNENLNRALEKATARSLDKHPGSPVKAALVFNVQNHQTEPLLNVADYLCWAIQRVFERGETRYYEFIKDKVELVEDLYDGEGKCYGKGNELTAKNKLSPPLH